MPAALSTSPKSCHTKTCENKIQVVFDMVNSIHRHSQRIFIKEIISMKNYLPDFLETAVELPARCLDTYANIFASSSADQLPFLTFSLS